MPCRFNAEARLRSFVTTMVSILEDSARIRFSPIPRQQIRPVRKSLCERQHRESLRAIRESLLPRSLPRVSPLRGCFSSRLPSGRPAAWFGNQRVESLRHGCSQNHRRRWPVSRSPERESLRFRFRLKPLRQVWQSVFADKRQQSLQPIQQPLQPDQPKQPLCDKASDFVLR